MQIFESASSVKKYLRDKGFDSLPVRRTYSPFSGDLFWKVSPQQPAGVSMACRDGQWYSNDGGITAGFFQTIDDALRDTNAFVG